jgi:ubiquinone/menaquinone biosynthesis C-methylase UbiE
MNAEKSDNIEDVVRELYRGILNREPEQKWLEKHVADIRTNGVRGNVSNVIRHFLRTEEFQNRFAAREGLAEQLLVNPTRVYLERYNKEFADGMPAGSLMLDVGAGQAPYKHLFNHVRYESADFEQVNKPYGKTTYVCDITERIPVEESRFDYILFTQTLEHIKEPIRALKELNRVLRPGGLLLCTGPLFYEEHEQPHDYFRYTQFAHRYMFEEAGFAIEKLDWLEGFFGTCGYVLSCMYRHLPRTVPGSSPDSLWARAFLAAFKPLALSAAGAFYRMDLTWKITDRGFPKNYAILARKPEELGAPAS